MSFSLANRLSTERHRQFVGRKAQIDLFRSALNSSELSFQLLYLFGPGGIGKTSLLRELVQECDRFSVKSIYLDTRNLEPTPESLLNALSRNLNLRATESPLEILAHQKERTVIFFDTYENLVPLDDWLRETFLPQLSANTLIAIASRIAPSAAWRSDRGWQALIKQLPLRNLSPEESKAYLTQRNVPQSQHQAVLDFTHGHPLALSLVADDFAQKQRTHFQPSTSPDIVKTLLERFFQDLPTPQHRTALEACALVRLINEELLKQILDVEDVGELFQWLWSLSFIESGQMGLFPHDLAREALIADLRWRNPERYAELHHKARAYYIKKLQQTHGQEQHRVLFDYIFLHRDNPAVRPRFVWQENSSVLTTFLQNSDRPVLRAMVEKHEGEESAKILAYWLEKQPQGVIVFRNLQQQPVGFVFILALHLCQPEELEIDPSAIASWHYLQTHAPLRLGEGATIFRFWMAKDTYQEVSPIQSLILINFVQHHRLTPKLAYTFFVCANPDFWAAMFAYADLARITEADFVVGEKSYGVYGHDWRIISPSAWQELLAQREIAASAQAITPAQVTEPVMVLSEAEFTEAVKDLLKHFAQSDLLEHNPLLRSSLLTEQTNIKDKITALQHLVREIVNSWQSTPKDEKLYRVLNRTYFHPAPTQEQAADLLDLPFSTYRRHLKAGIKRLTEILWQREIS
jgi:hypothetical protein